VGTVTLLVVEDDPTIGEPLVEALGREGFEVAWVRSGTDALAAAPADLALLDLGLPDLDGREVCRRLRARSPMPIIVLTARDDELERVLLLETGADDYVLKPFGFRELVARIRAVHRRSIGTASAAAATEVGDGDGDALGLRIDRRARRVQVDGTEVELTPKEFDLLALLAAEPGRALTREHIIERVWDENWWGSTKTLDVHIATLRKKLGDPRWITTLRGVGYRFDAPPERAPATVIGDP
jgi:DNA-binding response OmpR family regulator